MGSRAGGNATSDSSSWLVRSAMTDDVLIRVEGISKRFCRDLKRSLWYGLQDTAADFLGRVNANPRLRSGEFWAIKDISFELRRGDCLGLVGRNGAGKTTLLKILNGLIKPDRGRIEIRGRVGALIALGAGFNPVLTGRENVYVSGAVLGLRKKEIDEKYEEIIEFAEIGDFIDSPVQSYSSGMQVRLGFAVATAMDPDVLLLDEVLAVGDAAFRSKCFDRIGRLLSQAAVIFVSHSEAQIYRICNEAILLAAGGVIEHGSPEKVLRAYRSMRPHENKESPLFSKSVADVQLISHAHEAIYGGDLTIGITLQLREQCRIGAIFLHFSRDGEFVADGETTFGLQEAPAIGPGLARIDLCVSALNLQAGTYSLSLAIFDETRKQTLLHWLHFGRFELHGPVGAGPPHILPMSTTIGGERSDIVVGNSRLAADTLTELDLGETVHET
jgi:lipopolysaccharide transport system ATP-binding protein